MMTEGSSIPEWLDAYPDCVGPGWRDLLLALHDQLSDHYKVFGIREKFGHLNINGRTFFDKDPDVRKRDEAYVNLAEAKSFDICEQCGKYGKLRYEKKLGEWQSDFTWIKTLCDKHADEMGYVVK